MKRKVEVKSKHPWWHFLFERWSRTVEWSDGYLGEATPDMTEHHYCCTFRNCEWTKTVTEVFE